MTDRAGRHARWSVAALLAPASAAVFAGTMSWTTGHPPPATTTITTVKPVAAAQPQDAAALQQATEEVDLLRAQVSELRAQVVALKGGTKTNKSVKSLAPAPVAAPVKKTVVKQAPAPAVNTTTGAS